MIVVIVEVFMTLVPIMAQLITLSVVLSCLLSRIGQGSANRNGPVSVALVVLQRILQATLLFMYIIARALAPGAAMVLLHIFSLLTTIVLQYLPVSRVSLFLPQPRPAFLQLLTLSLQVA